MRLFKNFINHVGQKVLYWTQDMTDIPQPVTIVGVVVETKYTSIAKTGVDWGSLYISKHGMPTSGYRTPTMFEVEDSNKNTFKTELRNLYSNWTEWRELNRFRFCNKTVAGGEVVECLERIIRICKKGISLLNKKTEKDPNVDALQRRLCHVFTDVYTALAGYKGTTGAQELWNSLEAKRLREKVSKEARHRWTRNKEYNNAVQGEGQE